MARVLIADDDPLSRSLLREYLADQRLHSRWEVQLDLELDADLDRREVDTRLDVSRLAKVLGEGLAAADAGLSVVSSTGGLRVVVMVPVVDDRGSTSRYAQSASDGNGGWCPRANHQGQGRARCGGKEAAQEMREQAGESSQ